MEKLNEELNRLIKQLPDADELRTRLDSLVSLYPFNEYEYIISHLLARDILSLEQYRELRENYISRNLYLYIFEISGPRQFGEAWAQGHLKELVPELIKPTKKLDPNYSGQYDFLLDGKIRIEVKASRAVDATSDEPLYVKALSSDSTRPFQMNFQQIKPECCNVFVWIGVWRDVIRYWVLSSAEIKQHPKYSDKQHLLSEGEGQLHVTHENIHEFGSFSVQPNELANAIRAAYERQKRGTSS